MAENNPLSLLRSPRLPLFMVAGLVCARLVGILSATLEGLRGYGDMYHYFLVFSLPGWPFLNYWVEYPPIFPFLSSLLSGIASGQEHVFTYLMVFIFLLADAGSLYLFIRLSQRLYESQQLDSSRRLFSAEGALLRAGAYLLVMAALPYHWWYFEPLVVFFLLLGLTLILEGKLFRAGGALAAGIGLKFFPFLGLLAAWGRYSWKRLAGLALISLLPLAAMVGVLWLASPQFTAASLESQASKGSWETIWALIDGNIRTGSFGALNDRLDPAAATVSTGSPAVIPPLLSLVIFVGLGLWGLWRFKLKGNDPAVQDRQSLALVGFAWCLFMLWSPGWSPQWVLYLIPLVLLVLPDRQAYLLVIVLVLVNLLEWPVLLSRGFFSYLWVSIVLRTFILAVLAGAFYMETRAPEQSERAGLNRMV